MRQFNISGRTKMKKSTLALVSMAAVFNVTLVPVAAASEPYIYPAKGQGAEQQQKDRYECHVWASEQTGFDPSRSMETLPKKPAEESGKKGVSGSLIGGAALGTAFGAIAGKDIAESAAVGAGANVLRSQLKTRRNQNKVQQAYEADLALNKAYVTTKRADYDRARGACLTGRGYTVS